MNKPINKRGVILVACYMVIVVLTILGVGFIARSVSGKNLAQRHTDSTKAFWLAEAGVAHALHELKSDFNLSGENLCSGVLGQGGYSVDVQIAGEGRSVTAYSAVPAAGQARAQHTIEAMISAGTPENFYDQAVYSAGDVDFNGNSYIVDGDVLYAGDSYIQNPENINGEVTQDPQASPLARFDFEELLAISATQGNVYDASRLQDVRNGTDSFPISFWFEVPTDPTDPATGTPNVVYVLTDLQLNGNIGTIGGFYVVVGDVVTNPGAVEDLTINGNGQIDGMVYTRGEFRINGGGAGLNISGGVWAGEEVRLNGSVHIEINQDFMTSLEALDINVEPQIVWWRDTQKPFKVLP
ncbi:MAG: hypothetical protein PVI33_04575 [Candidatus Omnitrophota bacterium]|jgi:hypothetical protein